MWLAAAVLHSTILECNWGVLVPPRKPQMPAAQVEGRVLFISGSDFTGEFLFCTLGHLSGECLPCFSFLWAMRLTWLTYKTPLAVESMVFWDLTLAGFTEDRAQTVLSVTVTQISVEGVQHLNIDNFELLTEFTLNFSDEVALLTASMLPVSSMLVWSSGVWTAECQRAGSLPQLWQI